MPWFLEFLLNLWTLETVPHCLADGLPLQLSISIELDGATVKVLLIEDDKELADEIKTWLSKDRFAVELVHDGAHALHMLKTYHYDLLILDWQLPSKSGVEILHEYRQAGGSSPVLMLTGKATIDDKEFGFESGADDYLTKPFQLRELSVRLKALVRRAPEIRQDVLRLGNVVIDRNSHIITVSGQPLTLAKKEFEILELFVSYPDQVFSPEALLDRLWKSDSDATIATVRTHIKLVRQKCAAVSDFRIKTVHGYGYKLELT